MKREEQIEINCEVYYHFNKAFSELPCVATSYLNKKQLRDAGAKQLLTCNAWVWETKNYYVLQSYNTFIACIEKVSDICYDALRTEYGYTITSARHISKFIKSRVYGGYGCGKWGCNKVLRAYDIL